LLYGEARERLIEKLKPYAGQKAEIRYFTSAFNQYSVDNDAMGVVMNLKFILSTGAGWNVNPPVMENGGGTGISISINPKAPESTRKAASVLLEALTEVPLVIIGPKVIEAESPRPQQPNGLGTSIDGESQQHTN
jgi:hypothetical protein